MACTSPIKGYRGPGGRLVMNRRLAVSPVQMEVSCKQCRACRLERSRQAAIRIMHEVEVPQPGYAAKACFLTLTYGNDDLPVDGSLVKADLQRFFKRVRKKHRIRYYACGEYGPRTFRPHYHLCLFGLDFVEDREYHAMSDSGYPIYRSESLEKYWRHGYSTVQDLTFESAAYVARYLMKKQTGEGLAQDLHYLDEKTGVIKEREFVVMSLKPGIGEAWYQKFKDDVYPHGEVHSNGKWRRPPPYYDVLFGREDPQEHDALKARRMERGRLSDLDDERLAAREEILEASWTRSDRKW